MTYFFDDFSKFGGRTALLDDRGRKVTYDCLDSWADAFKTKVETRQMAICLCENTVGSAMGYVGFLRSRTVPLLLDRKIEEGLLVGGKTSGNVIRASASPCQRFIRNTNRARPMPLKNVITVARPAVCRDITSGVSSIVSSSYLTPKP